MQGGRANNQIHKSNSVVGMVPIIIYLLMTIVDQGPHFSLIFLEH